MQTIIYLIRHGDFTNTDGLIYGRMPGFHLNENGKKQLEKTAQFLQDKSIDEIYASPLERAKESAAIVQKKLGLPAIHISEEIIEIKTSYQGMKFSDLDPLQSEVYLKPLSPSDETIEQLARRMMKFLRYIYQTYPGKRIAAVSHGDPIMALKAEIKHHSYEFLPFKTDEYVQHGEVYEITSDENNKLSIKTVFKP